jgi:pyroglutamyl-peptidase
MAMLHGLPMDQNVRYVSVMRQQQTILFTGFGPFPGMPENISGRFVRMLADLSQRRFPAYRVVARILPTEWEPAPERIAVLYAREKPKVALHFGVSERAQGLVLETLARNVRSPLCDAAGRLPSSAKVSEDGPAELTAHVPVDDILRRVTSLGVPIIRSEDAGSYLCNAVLYQSLVLASAGRTPRTAGFIHIPHSLGQKTAQKRLSNGVNPIDWEMALAGAFEIVRTCLGREPPAKRSRVKPR